MAWGAVIYMACGDKKFQGQTEFIGEQMDISRQTSSGTPQSLVRCRAAHMLLAAGKKILDLLPLQITLFITARRHASTSTVRKHAAMCICRYGLVPAFKEALKNSQICVVID
jgi:hypothetical protein